MVDEYLDCVLDEMVIIPGLSTWWDGRWIPGLCTWWDGRWIPGLCTWWDGR